MRLLAAKMSGGAKAYAAVVLIRIMYSGMHVMSKVALDQGMNPLVFLFYRHTTAALVLIPVTFVVERFLVALYLSISGCFVLDHLVLLF